MTLKPNGIATIRAQGGADERVGRPDLTTAAKSPRAGHVGAGVPAMPALDGMRAVAIIIVMLSHTGFGKAIPGGFGVTIFFFLSGFLITTLLRVEGERTGRISLREFYIKRTLRIFPPMYLTIAFVAFITTVGWLDREITVGGLVADLLFLTNYAPQLGLGSGVAIPLWSLDVEEHFYLAFSLIFAFWLQGMKARQAAIVCAAIALSILFIRIGTAFFVDDLSKLFYWSHARIDSILWGSILALWHNPAVDRGAWRPRWPQLLVALGVLVLCLAIRMPEFRETLRYTLQGGALFVLFSFVLQDANMTKVLGSAPLRIVALLSYTLYLSHMPLIALAEGWRLPAPGVIGIVLAFIYAALMYFAVERPIARFRRTRFA